MTALEAFAAEPAGEGARCARCRWPGAFHTAAHGAGP